MTETVESYLQSKGINPRHASSNELRMPCFFCNEVGNKPGRLFVNRELGVYDCKLCGAQGHYTSLRRHFGDGPIEREEAVADAAERNDVPPRLFKTAAQFYHEGLTTDIRDWLRNERGLTDDTIDKHQLGWGVPGVRDELLQAGFTLENIINSGLVRKDGFEALSNMVTIPYQSRSEVLSIRGKELNGKYKSLLGASNRLYNVDACNGAEEIIFTEGEFDALVLEQQGFAAVGVPGAGNWKPEWRGYIKDVKRVYICFDNDEAGNKGAARAAEGLGPKAAIVVMPEAFEDEKKNDPTEWIIKKGHSKEEFEALLKASLPPTLLISPFECREEWYLYEGNLNRVGLTTGYTELDMKLPPGLLPGQLLVLLARTGTGKTLACINMMDRIIKQRKAKVLFVSLEQTRNEWWERAQRIFRFYNPAATDDDIYEFYKDNIQLVDKNKVTPDEFRRAVDDFAYRMQAMPDLIVVDYLGYFAMAFKGEALERTSLAVHALKDLAKECKVPIITPHQVNRAAEESGRISLISALASSEVENTADFVLSLYPRTGQPAVPGSKAASSSPHATNLLQMEILKSRHGNKGVTINFVNAVISLTIVPDVASSKITTRALEQTALHEKGVTPWQWSLAQQQGLKLAQIDKPWQSQADAIIKQKREEIELRRPNNQSGQPGDVRRLRSPEDGDAPSDEDGDESPEVEDNQLF